MYLSDVDVNDGLAIGMQQTDAVLNTAENLPGVWDESAEGRQENLQHLSPKASHAERVHEANATVRQ